MDLQEIIQIAAAESLGVVILLPIDEISTDEETSEDSITISGGGAGSGSVPSLDGILQGVLTP
jgi:hypothetical protein